MPFDIKRVFYPYDVPGGADRGGHALKSCHQFPIAMSGSFDVIRDDGTDKRRVHLNRSYYGSTRLLRGQGLSQFATVPVDRRADGR